MTCVALRPRVVRRDVNVGTSGDGKNVCEGITGKRAMARVRKRP